MKIIIKKIALTLIIAAIFALPIVLAFRYFGIGQNIGRISAINKFVSPSENKIISAISLYSKIAGDQEEKAYLLLFQNNLEIRPAGGFIGSYGIVKTKGKKITNLDVEGVYVLDRNSSFFTKPPAVMKKYLRIRRMQFRDSNWCPDFPTAAKQANYFYHQEGGKEKISGVVAINPYVLVSIIKAIGPVCVDDFCLKGNPDDIINLEYQIEKAYAQKRIPWIKRKNILKKIAPILKEKYEQLSPTEKLKLLKKIEEHLQRKDILIYFFDNKLQKRVEELNWGGQITKDWNSDYLMIVDSNFLSKKTDYYINRSINYKIDLTKERPIAQLEITYKNTGKNYNWMTTNYRDYLRIYVPKGSWLTKFEGGEEKVRFLDELNKTVFGNFIIVKLGQEKTIKLEYLLPKRIKQDTYKLLIQKQSGISNLPVNVEFISDKPIKNFSPGKVHLISPTKLKFSANIFSDKVWKIER